MIRTSKHTIKFANKNKQTKLKGFIAEYRRVAAIILDHLWNNPYHYNNRVLDVSNQSYDCPSFISTTNLDIPTTLSARALKCCSTQVCSAIKAALEKPRKRQYMLSKLTQEGKPVIKLQKAISKQKIVKPDLSSMKAELNSICCDYQTTTKHYDAFLQLKSIGKTLGKIRIPIKNHRHSNKLQTNGKMLASFLVSNTMIDIRYELPNKKPKTKGTIVGADQGLKDVLTLSNGNTTPKQDLHGHTLESITRKLTRKTKGSKAFSKAQEHRKNFIHWSINQLNFSNIKQINLEKITNINYRKKTSRLMSHWCNTLIRDKLLKKCEEQEVLVKLQPSVYRSQRCFSCGWVQKANRKSKQFQCKKCGRVSDADLNAAKNLVLELPKISFTMRNQKPNLKGFFWRSKGFSLDGEDFTVPLS